MAFDAALSSRKNSLLFGNPREYFE